MYLFFDRNGNFKVIEEEETLKRELLNATFACCNDPCYEGIGYQELYDECIDTHDFHSIAVVFEIIPDKHNDPFSTFEYPKYNDQFTLKRIY